MKIRTGFVSNSSSASFIINTKKLSELQKWAIRNHIKVAQDILHWHTDWKTLPESKTKCANEMNRWSVKESKNKMNLSTIMDNFDMEQFLKEIKVKNVYVSMDRF